jgi:DNA mismatch repair protein MutL
MPPIRKLPPEVSSKIAAGEVIERPSSVVKELVENSLDAGASRVTVELVDGGKSRIRVEDNGLGIPSSELPLASDSFSTSKIVSVDDIALARTLGFRGEALASIRAVSRLTLRSRTKEEDVGRAIAYQGEAVVSDEPHVRNAGTEIIVEDLFFNLPARKKFLRSGTAELRRIVAVLQGYALCFPETSFTLRADGRDILSYHSSNMEERIEAVLGSELFGHLLPIERAAGGTGVHGRVSAPNFTRANRYMQFYFVNRRYVKDRVLSHAVNRAYQSVIPSDRHPAAVLFLDVPPQEVDVNVHPTKAEVRFRNEGEIHRLVVESIGAALTGGASSLAAAVGSAYRAVIPEARPGVPPAGGEAEIHPHGPQDRSEAVWLAEPAGGERTFELHEAPLSLFGGETSWGAFGPGRLYWQLHESFILIQIRGGMVIIDQHAAHERILFDAAKKALTRGRPVVQSLLFPATIELSPEEYERSEELRADLSSLGFEIEPFGPRSVIVRGIPAGVRNWSDGRLLQEILGGEGRGGTDDFLKAYACHAAVKAGTALSMEEMENLADQLFATDLPYTCPHGRPTLLRVSLGELERRFARTVTTKK